MHEFMVITMTNSNILTEVFIMFFFVGRGIIVTGFKGQNRFPKA